MLARLMSASLPFPFSSLEGDCPVNDKRCVQETIFKLNLGDCACVGFEETQKRKIRQILRGKMTSIGGSQLTRKKNYLCSVLRKKHKA